MNQFNSLKKVLNFSKATIKKVYRHIVNADDSVNPIKSWEEKVHEKGLEIIEAKKAWEDKKRNSQLNAETTTEKDQENNDIKDERLTYPE